MYHHHLDADMTIGELMEWRYFRAEFEKEQGNSSFKKGDYDAAIERYKTAHQIEPEMPHYQLNLAAAYLKIQKWMEAEKACDAALSQHQSVKGHWRRAQARKAQGKAADAVKDIRAVLRLQPSNLEAQAELDSLVPSKPPPPPSEPPEPSSSSPGIPSSSRIRYPSSSAAAASSSAPAPSSSSLPHPSPSSSRRTATATATSSRPTRGKQKPLPFARSAADNRKLRICSSPVTIEVPVLSDPPPVNMGKDSTSGAAAGAGMNKAAKKMRFGNAKGKQGAKPSKGKATSTPRGGSATSEDGMEYRPQTFSYPSWERYSVKVSD